MIKNVYFDYEKDGYIIKKVPIYNDLHHDLDVKYNLKMQINDMKLKNVKFEIYKALIF